MKLTKYALCFLIFTGIFFSLQRILIPKYMTDIYDGALISEYYAEPSAGNGHSVIFIGDCEVYQNFSPAELFREYGITSYIRGGASQTIWQSYYLLEDTLRYETPSVVVLSILGMDKSEAVSEAYNRINIEGMRLSQSKLSAVDASKAKGESKLSYIFPILRYHERWRELSSEDFEYFLSRDNVGLNGYLMRCGVEPLEFIPAAVPLREPEFSEKSYEYLDKIRELCQANGIELILIKAPTIIPHWHTEWDAQVKDYAEKYDLRYYNLLELQEETGIDYSTDTPNRGQHMNVFGSEKLSRWLGGELAELDLPDGRENPEIAAVWEKKLRDYDELKETQLSEFERDGKVSTIIYRKK